jgi:hypothetical protein
MSKVCAFVSVCAEDACWVPQFVSEMERLSMPFVVLFDRCHTHDLYWTFVRSELCVSWTSRLPKDGEFTEQCKQVILDRVAGDKFDWAMAMDVDETFERDAPAKIAEIVKLDADLVDVRWLNLWGDKDHVRVDLNFAVGHRVKFYNLRSGKWVFDHPITNGAKLQGREAKVAKADLVCLHHGFMTQELRVMHKERWDRIYSTALRGDKNPYGAWAQACDESIEPVLIRHGYF